MKINSCTITSFGKFKNRKIDFSDGFNLVYGENEAGKSTIMSFIKMMFYGNAGRVSDIAKNLRLKYSPWDSSLMAGTIDFSHKGKNYRIEREFKGSNATDKIKIIDLDLKTEIKIGSKGDIGSEIFGLSESAFEKSIFIGYLGAPEKNSAAEGELNGKLSNIASTGDEDVSLELITSRLLKAKEHYISKSRKIGVYDKGLAELERLDAELLSTRQREADTAKLEALIKEKEEELSRTSADGNRYFSIMKKAELFKKKTNLQRYIEASRQKTAAENKLRLPDGSIADKNYSENIKKAASQLSSYEKTLNERMSELSQLKSEAELLEKDLDSSLITIFEDEKTEAKKKIESLSNTADTVKQDLYEQRAVKSSSHKKINIPLVIIGPIITLICGVLTAVIPRYLSVAATPLFYGSIVGTVLGIILFVLAFFTKKDSNDSKNRLVELENKLFEINRQIEAENIKLSDLEAGLSTAIAERGGKTTLLDAKKKDITLKSEAVLTLKNEILEFKASLSKLCEPFESKDNALETAKNIDELLSEIQTLEVKLNLAADSTNAQSLEDAENRLSALLEDDALNNITAEEVAAAKDEFKRHTELTGKLREELATLNGRLRALITDGRTVPVIELEKKALCEKLQQQKAFCDAADIANEVLTESFSSMRQSFGSLLEAKTEKIFKGLCDDAYSSLDISKDFDIKVSREDVFGAKEWQFLSSGTTDQAYLSLRLALIELISDTKDALPIIMDDSLAQYDDKRVKAAIKYLKEYSKEHQLILFTCHDSLKAIADSYGANLINI